MSDLSYLAKILYSIKDRAMLEDFLLGLTTSSERAEFTTRIEIIKRLLDGTPQHTIASELHVGVATVTRGAKELTAGRFKTLGNSHDS